MFFRAAGSAAGAWEAAIRIYRFLLFVFVLGGTMAWIMIKVRVYQETFYDGYCRKASEREYQRRLEGTSELGLQKLIK